MTQAQAWQAFDHWLSDRRVLFIEEPPDLDILFRALSRLNYPSPKTWADSYLAAFAVISNFRFVTFDRA